MNLLSKRFNEINDQLKALEATRKKEWNIYMNLEVPRIDGIAFIGWKVKVKNLLSKACGDDSVHMIAFIAAEAPRSYVYDADVLPELGAIFLAAMEDFEGGYLSSVRTLVQAEVFTTELEQASELLGKGFKVAAAVIAGTVLETGIRELCDRRTIPHAKLDKMNADLAKTGVYTVLVQKRITTLADIRNNAAHGHPDQFNDDDVRNMIAEVERFLAEHLT